MKIEYFAVVVLILYVTASANSDPSNPKTVLQGYLDRGNISAALRYVAQLPPTSGLQSDDAYALIAAKQGTLHDFSGARTTIDLIADPRARPVQPSIVTRCKALTRLSEDLLAAGRTTDATQTINEAGRESALINQIDIELGDAGTIWAAQVLLGIAEARGHIGQRRAALLTLAKAENDLTGTIEHETAGEMLKRVVADYRTLNDPVGERRAAREQRIVALQVDQGYDERLIARTKVDAQDGLLPAVFRDADEAKTVLHDDHLSIDLLCTAARIRYGLGDAQASMHLLRTARKAAAAIKDPAVKKTEEAEIAISENSGPSH